MLEMGQGVMTSMPMLRGRGARRRLERTIKTEWAPADASYGNPNFGGQQLTAGSNSVRGMWKMLRESGATARVMLVTAAAQDLGRAREHVHDRQGRGDSRRPAAGG